MENQVDYIFCINTGRSGSHYLKTLFDHLDGCRSLHEPEPKGNGRIMRRYLNGAVEPMRRLAAEKARIIREVKENCRLYAETNHSFIKGFGWFMPYYLPREKMGVIILKRNKSKVAKSFLSIRCSPINRNGRDWLIMPDTRNTMLPPPQNRGAGRIRYFLAFLAKSLLYRANILYRTIFKKELNNPRWLKRYEIQCLEWYVEEIAVRAKAYKETFPSIKYYEVDVNDLNSLTEVQKMMDFFGYSLNDSLKKAVGKATNVKRGNFRDKGSKIKCSLTAKQAVEQGRLAQYGRSSIEVDTVGLVGNTIHGKVINRGDEIVEEIQITVFSSKESDECLCRGNIDNGKSAKDRARPVDNQAFSFSLDIPGEYARRPGGLVVQITGVRFGSCSFPLIRIVGDKCILRFGED